MNITVELVQTPSYINEMANENYVVKSLKMMIVLYSCNKKHLSNCHIFVNELNMAPVSSSWIEHHSM